MAGSSRALRSLVATGLVLFGTLSAWPGTMHADTTSAQVAVREGQLTARVADGEVLLAPDGTTPIYRMVVEVQDSRGTGEGWVASARLPVEWWGQLDQISASCGSDSTCTLPSFPANAPTGDDSNVPVLASAGPGTGMGDVLITATFTLANPAANPPPADIVVTSLS